MKQVVIFSLDDILADISYRYKYSSQKYKCMTDIGKFYQEDDLLLYNYELYKFFKVRGYRIYVFTSRSIDYEKEIRIWLQENNVFTHVLEMRKKLDYRPAYLVKKEFVLKHFPDPKKEIKAVFEADISCYAMYNSFNVKVYNCIHNITTQHTESLNYLIK